MVPHCVKSSASFVQMSSIALFHLALHLSPFLPEFIPFPSLSQRANSRLPSSFSGNHFLSLISYLCVRQPPFLFSLPFLIPSWHNSDKRVWDREWVGVVFLPPRTKRRGRWGPSQPWYDGYQISTDHKTLNIWTSKYFINYWTSNIRASKGFTNY